MSIGPAPFLVPLADWALLAGLIFLAQVLVTVFTLRLPRRRLASAAGALLVSDLLLVLLLRLMTAKMGAMDYSERFFEWRWWFLAIVLVLVGLPLPVWMLALRIACGPQPRGDPDGPAFHPLFRTALLLWLAAGAIILAVGGTPTTPARPARITAIEVEMPGLPGELDGLRVALLSDHHIGSLVTPGQAQRRLESLRRLEVDVIVDLGDITERDPSYQEEAARILGEQKGRLGAFAVAGNFDVQCGTDTLRQALSKAGVTYLENEAVPVEDNGAQLWLVGMGDVWTGQGDLERTMAEVPAKAPVILLSHSPDILGAAVERGIPLVLSGHLHGGQVVIPFAGPVVGMSKHGTRFAGGHHVHGSTHLVVSRGLGEEAIPLRLFCPPEIVVVTLRSPP